MKLLDFLSEKPLLNAPVIESLRLGEADLLEFDGDCAVLKHRDGVHFICPRTDSDAIKYEEYFTGHLAEIFGVTSPERFAERYPDRKQTVCYQTVYTGKEPPALPPSDLEIKRLDDSYTDFVYNSYSLRPSKPDGIRDLLQRGYIFGGFVGDKCVGFVGKHGEGSLGLLEVLPEYKRRGYGKVLETFIIRETMSQGRVPYAHIITDNAVSLALQRTVNDITVLPELVVWFSSKRSDD